MNRFLLIVSTLAVLGNFGDCSPATLPTRISGVFHLDYDHFQENVAKKAKLYKRGTQEDLFLDALSGIIQKTYLATDEIMCYVTSLNDIVLSQAQVNIPYYKSNQFPDDQKFAELTGQKNILTEKLTELMNNLKPVNEVNKHLWTMMQNDMNANTKIPKRVFDELKNVGLDIASYTNLFETTFKDFKMLTLMENFNTIEVAIAGQQSGRGRPSDAIEALKKSTTSLNKIVPAMTKTVNFALKMDYAALYQAQRKFRDIVMKALDITMFMGDFSIKK